MKQSNQTVSGNQQIQLSQPLSSSVIISNNTATCQHRTNNGYCKRSNRQCLYQPLH